MPFIDWSDSEGMCDLLIEFIREEMNDGDGARRNFLSQLLTEVSSINELAVEHVIHKLTLIQKSVDEEFKNDPVLIHITDLIHELERIR